MQLLGELRDWTATEIGTVVAALTALFTAIGTALRAYFNFRQRAERRERLANEHDALETDLASETIQAAIENQKQIQFGCDSTLAHNLILFRTHNGDGIPKPTTPIKSTALLEATKPSRDVDPILEDWQAEPVDLVFMELLATALAKLGETILIDAGKLSEGPMRDRYQARKTPFALLTYVDSIDHHPTFLIGFYGNEAKARKVEHRTRILTVAGRIRQNERTLAAKRARVAAVESQLTKSYEQEEKV